MMGHIVVGQNLGDGWVVSLVFLDWLGFFHLAASLLLVSPSMALTPLGAGWVASVLVLGWLGFLTC